MKNSKRISIICDEFLSPNELQWESQSTTSLNSPTGKNLINIGKNKYKLHVFVRKYKKDECTIWNCNSLWIIVVKDKRFILKLDKSVPVELFNDFTRIVKIHL